MELSVLVLTALLALASGKDGDLVYNINEDVDAMLIRANRYFRALNMTAIPIQEGDFGPGFFHSKGTGMALDSLIRTGDCTYTIDPANYNFTYDYRIGASLLNLTFDQLEFMGKNQSEASIHINKNSLHVQFTSYKADNRCDIVVQDLSFEVLEGIEFSTSSGQYEPAVVERYFNETVFPEVNNYLKRNFWSLLQAYLTNSCTRHPTFDVGNLFQLFMQPYSESLK